MGYWKRQSEELNQCILEFKDEKYVCADHFDDPNLKKFINDNGIDGFCSYCQVNDEDYDDLTDDGSEDEQNEPEELKCRKVILMSSFMKHVTDKLSQVLSPLEDANLPLANDWIDDDDENDVIKRAGNYAKLKGTEHYENVDDMLEAYGLYIKNQKLNKDIKYCFNREEWIDNDSFGIKLGDDLSYRWRYFVDMVMNSKRFTFFSDSHFKGKQHWESDVLTDIMGLCSNLVDEIPVGTILFRGRPLNADGPFIEFKDLTSAPKEFAKANRMSAEGISVFYGSFDKETPLHEIWNYSPHSLIDLGRFKTTKPLKVVNLFKIPANISFWMDGNFEVYAFLSQFHKEVSKPKTQETNNIEYVPTQVFTEYIRYMNGLNIGGIIYGSLVNDESMNTNSRNVVLFYDNETSGEVLSLENVEHFITSPKLSMLRRCFLLTKHYLRKGLKRMSHYKLSR